jgi:hypothetical protein
VCLAPLQWKTAQNQPPLCGVVVFCRILPPLLVHFKTKNKRTPKLKKAQGTFIIAGGCVCIGRVGDLCLCLGVWGGGALADFCYCVCIGRGGDLGVCWGVGGAGGGRGSGGGRGPIFATACAFTSAGPHPTRRLCLALSLSVSLSLRAPSPPPPCGACLHHPPTWNCAVLFLFIFRSSFFVLNKSKAGRHKSEFIFTNTNKQSKISKKLCRLLIPCRFPQ